MADHEMRNSPPLSEPCDRPAGELSAYPDRHHSEEPLTDRVSQRRLSCNNSPRAQESRPCPDREYQASVRPIFEDFRSAETPPPVFATDVRSNAPVISYASTVAHSGPKKRPKAGLRGVSFSKSIPGLRDAEEELRAGAGELHRTEPRRASSVYSRDPSTSIAGTDAFHADTFLESPDLHEPTSDIRTFSLQARADTTSSIEDWLGLRRTKRGAQTSDGPDSQRPSSRRSSLLASMKLPRISSFHTEKEFRAMNQKASASLPTPSIDENPHAFIADNQPSSPRREKSRLFRRSASKRSLASQPTTPSADSEALQDPVEGSIAPHDLALTSPRSPRSPSHKLSGLLWQSKGKSHGEEGDDNHAVLWKSRRTGTFDEFSPPPAMTGPELRLPDLNPRRPPIDRTRSSQISPGDESVAGRNYHLLDPFEKAIVETSLAAPARLAPPPHRQARMKAEKSRGFLPSEARRINTPPEIKPGKGNRLMGHGFDHWIPGINEAQNEETESSQVVYTPFPMPKDAESSLPCTPSVYFRGDPMSAPTTPGGAQDPERFYRVRMDQIMDEGTLEFNPEERELFDWEVPDHLPTSPLCPANPKHPSKGRAICIYHGRGRTA